PATLDLARSAPLLCAGITTWSPLRHWKVGPGHRVGIIGLGGLGHMAVQLASRLGAEVTVFSTSTAKEADARRLGAHHFVATRREGALEPLQRSFDFLLSTVSSAYVLSGYVNLLKLDATLVIVGAPPASQPPVLDVMPLLMGRRRVAGSAIGGIRETQEMLDFCGEHNIAADIELIEIDRVNEAYERVLNGDVRYRFVLDLATL
ncbi:MAG: NAD(P)-dependent alcohol dehydrogenase, partial [Proteobacteria bacterium]|nr:NAD(P)-dependent alcohol dehydrogenase [Pseudomonadota bacterium]